jgi:hypothetical protein
MAVLAGAVPGLAALAQDERAALLALPRVAEDAPLSPESEAVLLRCDAARLWAGEQDMGCGALVATSARVVWLGAHGAAYQLEYPQLIMHAVCTDEAFAPSPCIYCQLAPAAAEDEASDRADDEEEQEEQYVELRIIPQDPAQVGVIFAALSRGAALFPCPDEDADEDMLEGGVTMAGLMMGGLQLGMGLEEEEDVDAAPDAEERARRLAKWDALLQEDGQFDDVEDRGDGLREPDAPPPSSS